MVNQKLKIATSFTGCVAAIATACVFYYATFYYGNRFTVVAGSPGSKELLEGAAMGLLVGLTASAISIPFAVILGKSGRSRAAWSFFASAFMLSALAIAWYYYAVSVGRSA